MADVAEALPRAFGPYTLLQRLGQGGMAEVLLARQEGIEGTQRLVAIKRVHPSLAADEEFVEMFLDEVRIVVGLNHPNIGHILDVGQIDGDYYIAMEYIQGRDLALVLRAAEKGGGRVPLDIAAEIGRQVCAALHYAHRRSDSRGNPLKIVHRDITPDNVIITFDGQVKLVDFGIATAANRLTQTRAGMLKGKPPYMAPEQILGEEVDGRADLFALGALLYRTTTRLHPFSASSPEKTFRRVVEETPLPPQQLFESLPLDFSEAILRALEKDPKDRFPDARSFQDALDAVAARNGYMPSPRKISSWLASLFPEAADARSRLLRDPEDTRAAATASYLSVSVGDLPEDPMEVLPTGISMHGSVSESASVFSDEFSDVGTGPSGERTNSTVVVSMEALGAGPEAAPDFDAAETASAMGPVPESTDPSGVAPAFPDDSEPTQATEATVHPEWVRRQEEPSTEGTPPAPPPATPPAAGPLPRLVREAVRRVTPPAPEAPPRTGGPSSAPEVWSLREHWEHLPPTLRSPLSVAVGGALATAVLVLAVLGALSLF